MNYVHMKDANEPMIKAMKQRIAELEEENQRLRNVEKAAQAVVDSGVLDYYMLVDEDDFNALAAALEGE